MTDEKIESKGIVWMLLPKMPVFHMSLTYSFLAKGIAREYGRKSGRENRTEEHDN